MLRRFFPDVVDRTTIVPDAYGETIEEVHDRMAYALARIIAEADAASTSEEPEAIVLSSHAAPLIAIGRALQGRMPEDPSEKDFDTFTCSISTYLRRSKSTDMDLTAWTEGERIPKTGWRGKGVGGGWTCTANANVDHLINGGERNWPVLSFLSLQQANR